MKSTFLLICMMALTIVCHAQDGITSVNLSNTQIVINNTHLGIVTVNGKEAMTEVAHFESGESSKVGKKAKTIKNGSRIVSAGVILGGVASGNGMNVLRGLQTANKVNQVARVAEATEVLTSGKAMYLTVPGKGSKTKVSGADGVRIMIESSDTIANAKELFAVVRFETEKKKRRFMWSEVQEALVSTIKGERTEFVDYNYERVDGGWMLVLKEEETKKGEYGIVRLPLAAGNASVNVATFCVKK